MKSTKKTESKKSRQGVSPSFIRSVQTSMKTANVNKGK